MAIRHSNQASGLAEVLDRVLDQGIVIDAFVVVSLVGIALLDIEARVVIASVETWLRYADAVGLTKRTTTTSLTDITDTTDTTDTETTTTETSRSRN